MADHSLMWLLVLGVVALIIGWIIIENQRIKVKIPLNGEHAQESLELFQKIRFRSSAEQIFASFEVIDNAQFSDYIDKLAVQYSQFNGEFSNYIQRIPYTRQGQQFFSESRVGWHNKFTLTLIVHEQYEHHHEILIANTTREATMSLLLQLKSSIKSLFGYKLNELEQLERIMTNLNVEKNKQIVQNLMMFAIGDRLEKQYGNQLSISYVEKD